MFLALALLCPSSTVPLPAWQQRWQISTFSHAVGKLAPERAVLGASPGGGLVGAAAFADLGHDGHAPSVFVAASKVFVAASKGQIATTWLQGPGAAYHHFLMQKMFFSDISLVETEAPI